LGLPRPIAEYESVAGWRKGLAEQWGGDPLGEEPDKLESLAAFCEFVGKDPDELLAFCFLRKKKTGERFASVKRREEVTAQLRAWKAEGDLPPTAARKRANDVLSFLIHGGVLMNPGAV